MDRPGREDRRYPPFRRYWAAMPARGNISLFVGSWYREVSNHCLTDKAARKDLPRRYAQILQLESQLVCNGTLLLKFFLNVSKKEQKRASRPWKQEKHHGGSPSLGANVRHDEMTRLYEPCAETHREEAPWHVLPSQDKGASKVWTASVVIEAFTQAIQAYQTGERPWDVPALPRVEPVPTQPMAPLASFRTLQPLEEDY